MTDDRRRGGERRATWREATEKFISALGHVEDIRRALKDLPTTPFVSPTGYLEPYVKQADVWRLADELTALADTPDG